MHHIKESTEGVLKPRTHRILVLEGDYSGPEVMAEGLKVMDRDDDCYSAHC